MTVVGSGYARTLLGFVVSLCVLLAPLEADAAVERCLGKKPTIEARGGPVRGTPKADVILVRGRRAVEVRAGAGADRICGGRGRDMLLGQAGSDRFRTGRGDRTDADAGEFINGRRRTVRATPRASTVELEPDEARVLGGDPRTA